MSEHLHIDAVTQKFAEKIEHGPALPGTIKVTIGDIGTIYLEHIDNKNMASNKDAEADCGIQISEETYKKLISGELSGMAAFMQNKLIVTGDMSIAMQLGNFI
jgi:putative sterol carrier protein